MLFLFGFLSGAVCFALLVLVQLKRKGSFYQFLDLFKK